MNTAELERALPGEGEVEVVVHTEDHANEMYFVRRGDAEWVLRRRPDNPTLPTTIDVGREYRLLTALDAAGVRVAAPVHHGDDFYLMEKIDGVVIRQTLPPALDNDADRRRIGEELIDAMAELHAVDWVAAGLDGFGKPTAYVERMLTRWTQRMDALAESTRALPDLARLTEALREHQPPDRPHTVIHGDYHLLNVAFAPTSPARLAAIFDWEVATLGDPLCDLGWFLAFWRDRGDEGMPMAMLNLGVGALERVFDAPGWLSVEQLVARYAAATGFPVDDVAFYRALALWRMALICESQYARHAAGEAGTEELAVLGDTVPALARRALTLFGAA